VFNGSLSIWGGVREEESLQVGRFEGWKDEEERRKRKDGIESGKWKVGSGKKKEVEVDG
jgi:hypothetical protein